MTLLVVNKCMTKNEAIMSFKDSKDNFSNIYEFNSDNFQIWKQQIKSMLVGILKKKISIIFGIFFQYDILIL